jgi:hypothetical protein
MTQSFSGQFWLIVEFGDGQNERKVKRALRVLVAGRIGGFAAVCASTPNPWVLSLTGSATEKAP